MPDVISPRASAGSGGPARPAAGATTRGAPARSAPGRPIGPGLALIAAGTVWLLASLGVSVPLRQLLPGTLVVIGIVLLLPGSVRATDGLVGLGTVVGVFALVVALVPAPAAFSVGDRTVTVATPSDLETVHAIGAGTLTLDLRDLRLPDGVTRLTARVGMGELRVLVPETIDVVGDARVGLGELDVLGHAREGVGPTLALDATGVDGPVLELDTEVGMGTLEVRR